MPAISVNTFLIIFRGITNSIKSSQAISGVRCLYGTDVSRTISVPIIRFSKRRFHTDT